MRGEVRKLKRKKGTWSKKITYLLFLIMVAAFTAGCSDEYYYQMDESEYESEYDGWEDNSLSDGSASGRADYADVDEDYSDEIIDADIDVSKGNSGNSAADIDYVFRNDGLLESHYEKHGEEMGFNSPEEYEAAANRVINDEEVLHKIEAEDGDDVYYLERTNEFVVVSKDGYIRTYFYPNDGIEYFNRQ